MRIRCLVFVPVLLLSSIDLSGSTLSITKGGTGSGHITVNNVNKTLPFSQNYAMGVHLTVEAVAETGSKFDNWSGAGMSGTTNPIGFNMPAVNISATANFSLLLAPDISGNPSSWSFGSINVGNNAEKTFVISNPGKATLNVSSATLVGANASEFSIQSGGGAFTLSPSASRNIVVRFTPASAGGKSASLSFSSNDPNENPFLINLDGTGVATLEYITHFASFPAYPYNTAAYKQNNALVGCGPTTGAMMFGYFQAVYSLTDLLTNPGTGVDKGLNTAWALHGSSYMQTQSDGFGNVNRIKPGLEGYATSKGYRVQVTIHVSPTYSAQNPDGWNDYGSFGDAWTNDGNYMIKNADNTWRIDTDLFCNFLSANLSQGIPIFLTIDSDGNGGGDHWVALVGFNRTTKQYAFYNTYDTLLHWANIYYVADPGGNRVNSISLARTVTYLGRVNQTVPDIASNPTSWDYGTVNVGSYSDKTFVISNTGTANLSVSATTITGTNASDFSIQSGGGAFTLAAGATRNIVVRFTPAGSGNKSASLNITSNDPDENPFLINLSGTAAGTGPQQAIPSVRIENAPSSALVGQEFTFNAYLKNIGNATAAHSWLDVSISNTNGNDAVTCENGYGWSEAVVPLPIGSPVWVTGVAGMQPSIDPLVSCWVVNLKPGDPERSITIRVKINNPKTVTVKYRGTCYLTSDYSGEVRDPTSGSKDQQNNYAKTQLIVVAANNGVDENRIQKGPIDFALNQNYPNPFNLETSIRYEVPHTEKVFMGIYDISGNLVRILVNGERNAGVHEVKWTSEGANEEVVSSGIYIVRMIAGSKVFVRKISLIK